MDNSFRLFPEQASTAAEQVDQLYIFLLAVATFFTLLIFLLIVWFVFRYRRRPDGGRPRLSARRFWILETVWTLIPLALTMVMFGWGARVFLQQTRAPADCLQIQVLGRQWMWKVQHPDGRQELNTLHVPVGQPVQLQMISEDVIHSFYVPAFRLKQDVLPGRYSTLWFEATRTGRFHLFCAEYCGTSHSRMTGEIVVQEPAEYAEWLQGGPRESPVSAGQALFEQYRCKSCHDSQTARRGPPLENIWGRTVKFSDGQSLQVDAAYLRQSILDPAAHVVAGYDPVMPTYRGQISEQQVLQLIAYLKSLRRPQDAAANSSDAPSSEAASSGSERRGDAEDQP